MNAPALLPLVQVFSERMLNTAPESMVLAGLVWALLRLVGCQSSATRFTVWFSALAAIIALPFLAGPSFGDSHSQAYMSASLHREVTLSSSWAIYIFAAWAVGAGLLLLQLSVALWRVRQLRRNCSDLVIADLDPAVAQILQDFGTSRRVKLCASNELTVPAAIGFFRPAIVFSAWLLPQLSAEEIKVILLHEQAHLYRWDQWTNLAQKIVKAVFFFHPAVWWIENRLALEREMACDDIVLAQTASPRAYASFLISFAEKLQNARGLALAQALVSRLRQMSVRVEQILDVRRPRHTGLWKPVLGASVGLLIAILVAAPYAPRLVAFENLPSLRQSPQLQVKGTGSGPAALAASINLSRASAASVTRSLPLAPRPRAILAAFTPRRTVVPLRSNATSRGKPVVRCAKAEPKALPIQETFVILQTTEYDSSGSGVWTLCIWRVREGTSANRHLESAIVLAI